MNLYDTLKDKVRLAARALALPLGWEGEPFVPPHASHLRAQIVFENQRQATLGMGGLTKIDGRIEIKVVVKAGEDSLAATLADQIARRFPRGMTSTLTTEPALSPRPGSLRPSATANGLRLWSTWAFTSSKPRRIQACTPSHPVQTTD